MKIVYIGNFDPAHSTENHLRSTLERMGHTVIRAQENRSNAESVENLCRDLGADMLLWTRTWGLPGDAAGMLERVGRNCPTVAYHLDLYAGLPRGEQVAQEPWWRCQHVFTPDGGSPDFWARHNVHHHYLRPGVFREECTPAEPADELRVDVAFVGSYRYHPEWPYRQRLIDWLRDTYGPRFRLVPEPGQPAVRGARLNQLYASVKVAVGDSLCLGFDHPYYWSDRVYETIGRGGFIIHPWIKGLDEELVDGEHLLYYKFNDFSDLKAKIDGALADDARRETIRRQGHATVVDCCTYDNRLARMFEILRDENALPAAA